VGVGDRESRSQEKKDARLPSSVIFGDDPEQEIAEGEETRVQFSANVY
jgi:hypothetical protein